MAAAEALKQHPDEVVQRGADRLAALMKASRGEQEGGEPRVRKVAPLPPFSSSDLCEARRARYFTAPTGLTVADFTDDETRRTLFGIAGERLRINDEIVFRLDDALVTVFVVDQQFGVAQTSVLRVEPIARRAAIDVRAIPHGFEISTDNSGRWVVTRLADGARMNGDGSPTFEAARRALVDHASLRAPQQ